MGFVPRNPLGTRLRTSIVSRGTPASGIRAGYSRGDGTYTASRRQHAERRLVRSHVIVLLSEAIRSAAAARRTIVLGWRHGRLLLEGAVHAFMPPVLLRVSGLDTLGHDAELDPPYG